MYVLQAIRSSLLSFQALLQTWQVYSCLSTFFSFSNKELFSFHYFHWLFSFPFRLFSSGLIWFLWALVIFSWYCCSFLLKSELLMILNFPQINLKDLLIWGLLNRNNQLLCYGSSPLHQSSQWIASKTLAENNKLAPNRKAFRCQYLF